ncbi:Phosphatidylethanolamine N-methyltransferase [Neolecta irregularis DAH-3]|uniref:Phosphatidylethanolamine N-methyltransferase n=1 Tax=Neolecta irregularis (strain DAH-3) TaxID=1198029 RepID=A0A1U7LW91_NEOID|nr:Phosphatidylethanolamine N-methyltransferase [Neolecta irregularis DAH-3]|eukprot:OLL26888.1 Phosphatidylethanolamine N-methyltransferase [Neolecta irregularis DAH-3]
MVLNYTSFASLVLTCLSGNNHWKLSLLRWTIGVLLIALQIWTSWSIHDALGDFGWFFGDFFYPPKSKLSSTGIYRYLNNPERLLGSAAFWGCVVITNSRLIFAMALLSQICNIFFIQLVERPHMEKLYGDQVRKDAGLTKGIKRALKPEWEQKLVNVSFKVGKVVSETKELIEEAYSHAVPKESVVEILGETRAWLIGYRRLALTKIAGGDLSFLEPQKYHITTSQKRYHIGEPIKISWTAPGNHSLKDWIGIYEVTHNSSREITLVGSKGCWSGISSSGYEDDESIEFYDGIQGNIVLKGYRLPWRQGVWEVRYHHDKKHNVMAISQPFEIYVHKCEKDEKPAIEKDLFHLFQTCSMDVEDISEKDANKIVYAIKEMFGIEFSIEVICGARDIGRLAERICAAKGALKPFIST